MSNNYYKTQLIELNRIETLLEKAKSIDKTAFYLWVARELPVSNKAVMNRLKILEEAGIVWYDDINNLIYYNKRGKNARE